MDQFHLFAVASRQFECFFALHCKHPRVTSVMRPWHHGTFIAAICVEPARAKHSRHHAQRFREVNMGSEHVLVFAAPKFKMTRVIRKLVDTTTQCHVSTIQCGV